MTFISILLTIWLFILIIIATQDLLVARKINRKKAEAIDAKKSYYEWLKEED